jgi:hypothetical protein
VAAVQVRTARDAAEALVRALGLVFGEFTVKVADGKPIRIIRPLESLSMEALEELPVETAAP